MAQLLAEQARGMAWLFFQLSKKLGDYRFANFDILQKEERYSIESLEWSLLDASTYFTALAIEITLDDLAPVLGRVEQVTKQMISAVNKLETVNKVIGIATAAVKVAGAIMSGNPIAIALALDDAAATV